VPTDGGFHILTCLAGEVGLRAGDAFGRLAGGESVLVPASLGSYAIAAEGEAVIVKSFVP